MPPSDDLPTTSYNDRLPADTPTPPPPDTATHHPAASTSPLAGPIDAFEAWVEGAAPSDRYQLLGFHKRGGLGQVWRANDTVVGRVVALKYLRAERTHPGLAVRFVHEARITGQLEHPNIVPLYDLFRSADGPVYAMRFVDGENLAEAARGYHERREAGRAAPLELPRLLGAFVLVCEALAYAHSKGVLHRDLKGQNVLLGPFGQVCLADWGLAKWLGHPDRPGDPSPLSPPPGAATGDGTIMGTPAFMAPELARRHPATVATDVYGLGAMLYQVLTSKGPHTGTDLEILSKLESGEPVAPTRAVNPAVHPALDAVCRKALSKESADRYPTAAALADDVRAYLAGEPVGAYPEPWAVRAGRWARRHRAGVLAVVVGLAVFAVAASVAAVLVWQEKERTAAKQREAEAAKADEEKARAEAERQRDNYRAMLGVVRDYSDRLTDVVIESEAGRAAEPRTMAARQAALERAVGATEKLATATPDDPELQNRLIRLLRYTANLARLRNDRPTADKAYRASLELVRKRLAVRPGDPFATLFLGGLLREQAHLRADFGELADAEVGLAEAAKLTREGTREAGIVAWRQAGIGTVRGRFAEAVTAAGRSVQVFDQLAAGGDPLAPMWAGYARNAEAVALREAAAETRDYGPALTAHADAVARLRSLAESDDGPEARSALLYARLEQVTTGRLAKRPTADLLPDAEQMSAGWRRLVDAEPELPSYRHMLAYTLAERGRLLATLSDPTARALAAADLAAAEALMSRLRTDARDRPEYWRTSAEVFLAKAGLLTDKAERRWSYRVAFRYARTALTKSPADKLAERLQAEVVAVAKREGINPAAKAVQPGREAEGAK